jgi:Bacterial regulatory proteins, luxR family
MAPRIVCRLHPCDDQIVDARAAHSAQHRHERANLSVGRDQRLSVGALAALFDAQAVAAEKALADDAAGSSGDFSDVSILALVARGLCNKEIARDLGLSVATVKNHVHNILTKLSVAHRGAAIARLRSEPQIPVRVQGYADHGEQISSRGTAPNPRCSAASGVTIRVGKWRER